MKQLKYLLIVPLLLGMLIYSSCTDAAKDELLEMESILEQNEGITEGKYFDTQDGKIFVGKSLVGAVVPFEDYTDKEKEMHKKASSIENSILKFQIVIDNNGDRIRFLKTNKNADVYKKNWEYVKGEDVPFAKIEKVPVFPGCEGSQEELRKCLQENITKHVNRNFNSGLAKNLGLSPGVKRIFVMFKIDKEGNISEAKSRAPHKALEAEALRVINLLPKMIPGTFKGDKVGVMYSLPIAFKVGGNEEKQNKAINNKVIFNSGGASKQPLYILDGKEISKEEIKKIDPNTINSVNVLKEEVAIKEYGEKGKDGVIEITSNK